MWYSNVYRRNLVDMHIEDWNPQFLSKFSAQTYYENLAKAKIQAPMIYLQSHVGHCYWPTKTGHMHNALRGRENFIRTLIEKCRANGMYAVGYYSLIYNSWANDNHPEWGIINAAGKNLRQRGGRHGLSCPNNPGYVEFTFRQIEEIAEYFNLDGMFYDMLFWPDLCHCRHCKKRFTEETGYDWPDTSKWPAVDMRDPVWLAMFERRRVWMGEFAQKVTDETKRLMPGITVEHNCASLIAGNHLNCQTELVNEACDYVAGDLYGDLYNHSFAAKYYYGVTKNQPFEYMTCRCNASLQQHTVTKTEEALGLEIMLTAAHHGASFVIDGIDPRGTMDGRVYDRLGKIFERHIPYEQYFKGDMIADAAVWYSTPNRYNADGQPCDHKTCAVNAARTLIENHIPFRVIADTAFETLGNYKFIIVPQINFTTEYQREKLVEYVEKGGAIYMSGCCDAELFAALTGGEARELTKSTRTYLAPTKEGEAYFDEFNAAYPLPFELRMPLVKFGGEYPRTDLATITLPYTDPAEQKFASIHLNPPGIATKYIGAAVFERGKGKVIWSAAPLEFDSRINFRRILMNLCRLGVGDAELSVKSTASKKVELVSFRTEDSVLVSAVDLECTEELLPRPAFDIYVKWEGGAPSEVLHLPDRRSVPFTCEDGYVKFTVFRLVMFDMFEIR